MEIQEAKQLKKKLELDMLKLIMEFEETTGLIIENINTRNDIITLGKPRQTYAISTIILF